MIKTQLQQENWREMKLGDVAEIESGGTPSSSKPEYWDNGNICWATLPDLKNKYIFDTQRKITALGLKNSNAKLLPANSVIFSSRATIGEISITKVETSTNQGSKNFICYPKKIEYEFLYYLLKSKVNEIICLATGATYKEINKTVFSSVEINIPNLLTQKQIADVLSAYDDLIENNTKRIKILEEMAQAIYKEWFVSPVNGDKLPKGWKILQVEELVKRVRPGKLYDNKSALEKGDIPILDQGKSGIIGYHNDNPGVDTSTETPIIVFANHTCYQRLILFSFSAIQNVLPFYPSEENYRNIFWLHYATKDLIEFNDYKGHWPEFMQKEVVVPPAELAEKFGSKIKPLVVLSYRLELENKNLREARDLFLPKLVNGEIRA